jgi:hypothetical protein
MKVMFLLFDSWRIMNPKHQNSDRQNQDRNIGLQQAKILPTAANALEPTERVEALKMPTERSHELLGEINDERLAALNAKLDDPTYRPEPVAWRDDGPDPFGMDWEWLAPPEAKGASKGNGR